MLAIYFIGRAFSVTVSTIIVDISSGRVEGKDLPGDLFIFICIDIQEYIVSYLHISWSIFPFLSLIGLKQKKYIYIYLYNVCVVLFPLCSTP